MVYFTDDDLSRETGSDDREAIAKMVRANAELVPIFHQGSGTVFKVSHTGELARQ